MAILTKSQKRKEPKEQKTKFLSSRSVEKQWVLIDAAGIPLGRLASVISIKLQGKDKPNYTPFLDCGDGVIVINASKIAYTGKKIDQKLYRRHSGYPGGLKQRTLKEIIQKNPCYPLEKAVKGMLPKTKLGRKQFTHLRVYAGDSHPHQAQQPVKLEIKKGGRVTL